MKAQSGSIFVSAGEVSGDQYLARVYERLRQRGFLGSSGSSGKIYGLCGSESRRVGIEGLWKAERLQLLGITEVLGSLPDVYRLMGEMSREIVGSRPDALICVDSPDFHLPLIRRIRRKGYRGRIFYISPPSVWAWRSRRVRDLFRYVDECLPLFKFEHEYLVGAGCKSFWAGHPLVDEFLGWTPDIASIRSEIRGPAFGESRESGGIIALFPGSRRSEISRLYPILHGICPSLEERGFVPVFSVAPGLSDAASSDLISRIERDGVRYYAGAGRNLMAASEMVAGASGTATAEALLLRRHMVVMYRVGRISGFIGKMFLKHVSFAIPNLLAGRMFYPELIQEYATPEAARRAAFEWLDLDDEKRGGRIAEMDRLAALMGNGGVYDFWTDRILGVFA